jgi:hypothetical protein
VHVLARESRSRQTLATQTLDTHTLNTRTVVTQFTHTHTHLIHTHLIHTVATQTHSHAHAHLQRKHLVHANIERLQLHASTQVSRLNCAFIFVKDRKRDRADFGSASFLVPPCCLCCVYSFCCLRTGASSPGAPLRTPMRPNPSHTSCSFTPHALSCMATGCQD